MKKTIISIAAAVVMLPTLAIAAHDEYHATGINYSGPVASTPISQLVEQERRFGDQDVIVEGYLVRQTSEDNFIFSDGEDSLLVEIEDDIHLAEPISDSTKVRIFGEYEGGKTPRLEAEKIQVL